MGERGPGQPPTAICVEMLDRCPLAASEAEIAVGPHQEHVSLAFHCRFAKRRMKRWPPERHAALSPRALKVASFIATWSTRMV
jgi:hypothetical protein